jgi:copper transport protein
MSMTSRWRFLGSFLGRFLVTIVAFAGFPLAAAPPLAIHIHSESAMFQVLISPGTVGTGSFVLQLMSGDGSPLQAKERKAILGADGYWHVDDVPIPVAGRWHLRIDAVTISQKITLEDEFDVPAR